MRTRTTVSAAVCAVALLVLTACGGGGHHDDSAGSLQPAPGVVASRTIDISAGAGLKFDPATVEVNRGETVAFKVVNPDQMAHEFVVGDADAQEHHEEEMKELKPGEVMADDETGLSLLPGETKTIAFTFPDAGTYYYGCHQPGHYPAGMKGEIKVT